jgi:hypothetical protein
VLNIDPIGCSVWAGNRCRGRPDCKLARIIESDRLFGDGLAAFSPSRVGPHVTVPLRPAHTIDVMAIVITRKELYERVWAEPIQKLSKEYGLSDVGLAKICRRYEIPIPPRGHWAKKQAGKRVAQPPFPTQGPKGYGDQIRLAGPPAPPAPPAEAPEPLHPLLAAESNPENEISVPDDLRIRHPMLRSTLEYWRLIRRSNHRWDVPLPPHLVLNVSTEAQARALRLLQALFTALKHRSYELFAGERRQIQVKLLGETCELFVRERQRRVRRLPSPKTKGPSSVFESSRPFDLAHTGELEFRIEKRFGRQVVRDGKGRHLETLLNEVVVCLLKAALAEKDYRAGQERARLAQVERERRQALVKQRAREERARAKRLEQLVAAADHHKQLTVFAAELRDAVGDVEPSSELGRWLKWVDEYVDKANVLSRFRDRQPSLTLYHCVSVYEADGIVTNGFQGKAPAYGEDQELPASVVLTDVPMEGVYGGTVCVIVDMPEETALPYESPRNDMSYRRFRMPSDVINRFARRLNPE